MRKVAIPRKMFDIVMVKILVNIYQRMKRLASKNYMIQLAPHLMPRVVYHAVIYMANDVTTAG